MAATTHVHASDRSPLGEALSTAQSGSIESLQLDKWFSTKGRLSRAQFVGRILLIYVGTFLAGVALGVVLGVQAARTGGAPAATQQTSQALGSLLGLFALWPIACQVVKRLHDLSRPGSHYFLLFVPFYNLYLTILMLFKRGTDGPNAFGADPRPSRVTALSLPEVECPRAVGV